MTIVSREHYYITIAQWEHVPYCQWAGWVDAQATNHRKLLYLMDDDIACVGHLKRYAGMRYLMLQAPALRYEGVKANKVSAFYREVMNLADIVEVNDQSVYNPQCEVALRQVGFLRPVGSFSFQLTNMIDLSQPIVWDSNWQRHLKKIEGLTLDNVVRVDEAVIEDYMSLYREMCADKGMQMPYDEAYIRALLADGHFRLFFEQDAQSRRVAALLVHTSGSHAGLLYAATSNLGREAHAGFAIYRDVLGELAKEGFGTFDMEKMAASTHSTNAVYQFKQGIKGVLTPLNGEWQWCRRKWMPLALYLVKKYIWKRIQA
ncbi:MAG: GNAT family N-acetyltransferase [Paludibacteraceae bacterium]|nr:GNAT family N-acetyltransferase [Paludibacteraceae bacterium]